MKGKTLLIGLALIFSISVTTQAQEYDANQWLEDYDFVVNTIRNYHPNPYYRIGRDDFEHIVEDNRVSIEQAKSDEECLIATMRTVASLRDGHSIIYPTGMDGARKWLPFRAFVFEEGTFIIAAADTFRHLVAARLLKINGVDIEDVEQAVNTIIPSDNDFGRRNFFPFYLVNTSFLKGLGIIEDSEHVDVTIQTADGIIKNIALEPVEADYSMEWFKRSLKGPGDIDYLNPFTKHVPQYLKPFYEEYQNFNFSYLDDEKAFYLQINQLVDAKDLSFSDFLEDAWRCFDVHRDHIDSFILDLRFNAGGNAPLMIRFVKDLIKREEVLKDMEFSVLTGRQTFSAAIMIVSQLKTYTEAIFIGEPLGGPLHLWATALQLGQVPGKRFEFHLSSMEFHVDMPIDDEYMFPPQIPFPVKAEHFFCGRDELLEYVLSNDLKAQRFILREELFKEGSNHLLTPSQALAQGLIDEENLVKAMEKAQKLDYSWGLHTDECGFHPYGSQMRESYLRFELLMVALSYDRDDKPGLAKALFEILTIVLPQYTTGWKQYGEFLFRHGDLPGAVHCYEKAVACDIQNESVKKRLRELKKLSNN